MVTQFVSYFRVCLKTRIAFCESVISEDFNKKWCDERRAASYFNIKYDINKK